MLRVPLCISMSNKLRVADFAFPLPRSPGSHASLQVGSAGPPRPGGVTSVQSFHKRRGNVIYLGSTMISTFAPCMIVLYTGE
jgi:hypothetical protein